MKISALARQVHHEYASKNPFDICAFLGIIVRFHELGDLRGYYVVLEGRHVIGINKSLSPLTMMFVCAHELGHHFLHQRFNRVFMDYSTQAATGRFENEADKFAAHLLWGEPPLYDEERVSTWEMAECLNVAACNVDARLIDLGLYY